jgi:hypothetical protein
VRGEILKLKTKTILGDFPADDRGYLAGYNAVTVQWQDGRNGGLARRGGDGEAEIPDPAVVRTGADHRRQRFAPRMPS